MTNIRYAHSWAALCHHTFSANLKGNQPDVGISAEDLILEHLRLRSVVKWRASRCWALHTPHSTLHTPQREGRTLHRHLRPQALRIAEIFLTLSKEAHLEFFENHVKPVLSWKHRQPWKGQTVPAHPGKHRVRNTHLLNQHAIITIRDGSGYQNGWIFGKAPKGGGSMW